MRASGMVPWAGVMDSLMEWVGVMVPWGTPLGTLEALASVLTLACIVLSLLGRAVAWPVGIVAVVLYAIVFAEIRLYADLGLQGVYLAQGVWGWIIWTRVGQQGGGLRLHEGVDRGGVRELTWTTRLGWGVTLACLALAVGWALDRWTAAESAYLDATCSVLSLGANALLAMKRRDAWVLWVVADLLYLWLFASKGLWWSVGVYAIAMGLAMRAWWLWRPASTAPTARLTLATERAP